MNFSNLVAVTSTVAAQQLAQRGGGGGSAQAAVAAIAVTSFRRNLRNYFGPNPSSERRSSVGEQQLAQTPGCVTFTPYTTLRSSALQPHARAAAPQPPATPDARTPRLASPRAHEPNWVRKHKPSKVSVAVQLRLVV